MFACIGCFTSTGIDFSIACPMNCNAYPPKKAIAAIIPEFSSALIVIAKLVYKQAKDEKYHGETEIKR